MGGVEKKQLMWWFIPGPLEREEPIEAGGVGLGSTAAAEGDDLLLPLMSTVVAERPSAGTRRAARWAGA